MPTPKEIALGAVAGTTTTALLAWKTLFPYIVDDIKTIRRTSRVAKIAGQQIMTGQFLVDVFEDHVARDPKKTFIIHEDKQYSYECVNAMANRVASLALTWNLEPSSTIATMIYNEAAFVWTLLGLLKVGLSDAFINYHLTAKPLLHSLNISEAKVIIVGAGDELLDSIMEVREGLPAVPIYVQGRAQETLPPGMLSFDDAILRTLPTNVCKSVRSHVNLMSPMCFIYTSGTTGLPKPAIINHAKSIGVSVTYSILDYSPSDVVYIVTPLYHSAATLLCLFNTFYTGATMVLRKKFSASHFFEDCRRHDVTVIQYIGELFRYIMALPETPLDPVHKIRVAFGNGLRQDIWTDFQKRFNIPWIIEIFGATEATGALLNITNKVGACGRLSPFMRWASTEFKDTFIVQYDPIEDTPIRDKRGRCIQVKPGEQGLLITPIPPTYTGFYKGDEKLSEKKILRNVFEEGDSFFNFGDLLYLDKDYYIYFRDRVGDTFRWKGENVSTREVCDVISALDFVQDVNVYGVRIPGTEGRAGMAAISVTGNADVTADMLQSLYQLCQKDLPSYARPLFIRFQKDFIVTQTMKHRKLELVEEGFDTVKVKDPLYYMDNDKKTYSRLTETSKDRLLQSRL
ncbi:very long-chain acyl-CoA synthetase-like [Mizuhopecten yessoensis]|uniref:very long-chain acyl-CoA synthetase-like n=1 Tax=Mizuhopecten yessoensis TaxID=6573 RepID=UPI000B45E978|nr:very long-chain acyl-CoA synthetase-like [Mizuhopecten yessoensis]XP_021351478.1 very long-chain acyl-CoA synthetase-like [Mizuhopecten yessoensis]XP_021351480.1 very long-chain acyl-CoA synthetase-like [Mizuhopecten yessoensis]XP_021351481.1 very long-chain acyl-CoA synthetase-like [Mizuhopecten yessoensis]XP_021351482.1 very long-chain acyl-CoA synthetase-like [Mizuhopecten yessoensis]XP_021351483.1 very long-chain acyl-CoA synthetase-like [Mizuhopecten yessoensis]